MNFGNIVIMSSKLGAKSGDFAQRGIYYSQEIIKLLEKKWEKESLKVKREKGWLVFFLLLLPWVILLIL